MTHTAETAAKPASEWVTVDEVAERLPFSASLISQLIRDGVMPSIRIAGAKRSSHRIPRRLVEDAYAAVMAGGQVELRDFCRSWTARNATEGAVA